MWYRFWYKIYRWFLLHFRKDFFVLLEIDGMSGNFTLVGNDGKSHSAVLTCLNSDGSPAQNVTITYSSDTPTVLVIDASSGALTGITDGNATLTGMGTRGSFSHSDTLSVTVSFDPNLGDFTVNLSAT